MAEKLDISVEELYDRCVYSSIAHAVYTFREPLFSYEQSWDDLNYSFCLDSVRGTISFDKVGLLVAGAMREDKSERRLWYPGKKADELFAHAPHGIAQLATSEALEYLYDTIDGYSCPVATVAMWHDGAFLYLSDERDVFAQHGGSFALLLSDLTLDLRSFWAEQYELTYEELTLIDDILFAFKSGQPVVLSDENKKRIKKARGYNEGMESLNELGIEIRS